MRVMAATRKAATVTHWEAERLKVCKFYILMV